MIDSVLRITLNLQETNTLVSVKAKRGDTGRRLLIHLSDGSIPYAIAEDCYAVFTARKSDGSKIHNPCTIENQVIEYTFTEQTCASPGTMHCEIKLYGGDQKLLTSACFLMTVLDTVYREGDEVSSEGEMTTLDALISDANELIATVEHKLKNGELQGDDYVLTPEDKSEIAELAAELVDTPEGSAGNALYYMNMEAEWPVPEAEIRYYMVQKGALSNSGTGIKVGDVIVASNGTLCKVTSISGNTVHCDPIGTVSGIIEGGGSGGDVDLSDYLQKTELTEALEQAKQSGKFDGKTPAYGVDYWTEADQESIVQQVIVALGTPVFGRVDADNNILLTGNLVEGNRYTVKYEDADGNVTEIGSIIFEAPPEYTNVLLKAINPDETPFIGTKGEKGYTSGSRLNSSGTETPEEGIFVTGFIKVKQNNVVRLSGIEWGATSANASKSYLYLYKGDFTKATDGYSRADQGFGISGDEEFDASGNLVRFTLSNPSNAGLDLSTVKYMRLSSPSITADSVITIDQEIV